jgi:exopolysaccharide production protein ExoQ
MPPLLALLLCIVFVVYRLHADKENKQTIALWIPSVWLLYCGSRALVYWFGPSSIMSDSGSTLEEGSPIDRLFLSVLIVLALVVLAQRGIQWRIVFDRNRWLVALYSYALISILWSEVPFSSVKRFVRLIGGVLMALAILTEPSPRKALETVFKRLVYILIPISLVLIKYFPNFGVTYRTHSGAKSWIGVTMGKNQLGILCMVSAFFLLWNFFTVRKNQRRHRSLMEAGSYFLVLGLSLFMMFGEGAYSATALFCLPAGIVTFGLLRWAQRRCFRLSAKTLIVPVAAIFLIGASLPFLGTSPVSGISGILGRDATLTSRTDIWETLRPFAVEMPVFGHGYGGFWTERAIAIADVNEAHNGYLEVVLILGVSGLVLLFGFLISYCRHVHRSLALDHDAQWAIFGFCLLIMLVLHEATEASFLSEADLLWTCVIFVSTKYRVVEAPEPSVTDEGAMDAPRFIEEAWT